MEERIGIQRSILQKAKNSLELTCKQAGINCDHQIINGINQVRKILASTERTINFNQESITRFKGLGIAISEVNYYDKETLKIVYKEVQRNNYFKNFDLMRSDNLAGFFSIVKEYYNSVRRKGFPDLTGKTGQKADSDEIKELTAEIATLNESYNKYFQGLFNPNY